MKDEFTVFFFSSSKQKNSDCIYMLINEATFFQLYFIKWTTFKIIISGEGFKVSLAIE